MFGFKFVKLEPNEYVLKYKKGKIVKQGEGLSFWFFLPATSLSIITTGSIEEPFIFEDVTADFQQISIQGQITYRIAEPGKISRLLNFTIDNNTGKYISEDPEKVSQRVINIIKVLTAEKLKQLKLKEALKSSEEIVKYIINKIRDRKEIISLGLEILGVSILAVKASPDVARALEAEAREQIMKESDNAIYLRRNSAVEQERLIKENELKTEIAVENKKREIKETQLEADKAVQLKNQELKNSEMQFDIKQEDKRQELIKLKTDNDKLQADTKAYALTSIMKSFTGIDPVVVQSLTAMGMDSNQLIANAFQGIAERANKIGQLNITPELLMQLTGKIKK